jgi:hypothetical protein
MIIADFTPDTAHIQTKTLTNINMDMSKRKVTPVWQNLMVYETIDR